MQGFTQVPCPKCGSIVYVASQVGYGVCPSCHTQTSAGAPMGVQGMGPGMGPGPGMGGMPVPQMGGLSTSYGRPSGARMVMSVVAVAVVAAAGSGFYFARSKLMGPGKGKASYSAVGMDADKPSADKMITSVAGLAKKWRSDAIWWSVNLQEVHADGTVNVSNGAVVEYISPSKVSSAAKTVRKDGIKKFSFGPTAIDYGQQWDAMNQWKGVEEPAAPTCSIADLMKKLEPKGLKGTKTVRVTFDPQWDWGEEQTWHVIGQDPRIDARFSMKTCDEVGAVKGGGHSSEDE